MYKKTDGKADRYEFLCTRCNRHWFEACPPWGYYERNSEKGYYEIKTQEGAFVRVVCCPDCGRAMDAMRPYKLRDYPRRPGWSN